MVINYICADGRAVEIEVSDELGRFYFKSLEEERRNERRETRRHVPLTRLCREDEHCLISSFDVCESIATMDEVRRTLARLTTRQRGLIINVYAWGWHYTEIAAFEKRNESTIRRSTEMAKKKFTNFFVSDSPI